VLSISRKPFGERQIGLTVRLRAGSLSRVTDPAFHRIRLTLHYDGRAFHGWQVQPEQRTVQGELERILSRLTNRETAVVGSGRTDRGVHATGQVAAADVPLRWTAQSLRRATNALLPDDVWVADAALAPRWFHPRYDAATRSYVYRIGLAQHADSPFHAPWCWPLLRPIDLSAMEAAAALLVGEHSFKAFAKAGQEERGDRCTVAEARWAPWEGLGLEFHVTANRFLHHMVRYLVGTMVDVGLGERPVDHIADLLDNAPGLETSPPAPPEGLFLTGVSYPADAGTKPPKRRRLQLMD
jgi:tRNA pseudouridine38-40 synthase